MSTASAQPPEATSALSNAIRAVQARAKIGKLMAEDKIQDAECDALLSYTYTPPTPAAAAEDAGAESEGGAPEEKSEKGAPEAATEAK